MKHLIAALQSVVFLLLTHCVSAQQVQSLNPLFTERSIIVLPQAERMWFNGNNDPFPITIKRSGDNFYLLQYGNKKSPSKYEAVFVSIDSTIFLDITPILPDTLGDNDYRKQILPTHSFYKFNIDDSTLQLAELNYRNLQALLTNDKSILPFTWSSNGILLTAQTQDLLRFIEQHLHDSLFFNESITLRSAAGPVVAKKNIPTKPQLRDNLKYKEQICTPAFPHKDGWLGGDADVSVPVNDSQTLYIFGDTYVAGRNDNRQSRSLQMVSSTVAISTCSASKKMDTKYFWRNMYTPHPEPIFRSMTNRYALWVISAVMHQNSLYALMQKTSAKTGSDQDDFFNFNPVGFVLAKVKNPMSSPPDKWDIEYIPINFFDISPSMAGLHITLVKSAPYLYFFTEKENRTRLLRIKLDQLDSPGNHFEYYSLSNTWLPGLKPDDMKIVLDASIGSTINYHDDIKKWLMVCGPDFMDNKISIRTATSLTGPWSTEKIVYECPEITPGNASYHPSNFCYMARECVQYYNRSNKTLIITYDINNKDFSQIRSNPKIYTPKLISVPLGKYDIR